MAESNGNGRTTTARAEYEAATKDLRFSKDFFPALEAIINDPLETIGTRVLAWYKRRSWGNFSLYAINDDGSDAQQSDCALALCTRKQYVSRTINYYVKRGYLYREGKKVYPSLSPSLGPKPEKVTRSCDFLEFYEEWKVTHSSDFRDLEVARSTVERIRKVILSGYRESRRARTNGGPSLNENIESPEREDSQSVSPLSVNEQETDPTDGPTDLTPILDAFEQIGQRAVDDQDAAQILSESQKAAPELDLEPADVADAIVQRGKDLSSNIQRPVRFLRKDVPAYVTSEAFRRFIAGKRRKPPPIEEYLSAPADDDPVISTVQCSKCGGVIETYRSGEVSRCACAARGAYATTG